MGTRYVYSFAPTEAEYSLRAGMRKWAQGSHSTTGVLGTVPLNVCTEQDRSGTGGRQAGLWVAIVAQEGHSILLGADA